MSNTGPSHTTDAPYCILDGSDESILDRFVNEQDRDEALLTGEYPEDAKPAYVNDPTALIVI